MTEEATEFSNITITYDDNIQVVTLTTPKKKNAINFKTYTELVSALNLAEANQSIEAVILTGEGEYFTSGADLTEINESHYNLAMTDPVTAPVGQFMSTVMRFTKLLVAAVNGPAVGIGVTLLTHCDISYCSTTSTFWTPFASVGVVPEFCSSVTFPIIFGPSIATEMLLGLKVLSASEAKQFGLVSDIFPPETALTGKNRRNSRNIVIRIYSIFYLFLVLTETVRRTKKILALPLARQSVPLFKRMVKKPFRNELDKAFRSEMAELGKRTLRGETSRAISATLQAKRKQSKSLSKL